MLWIAGLEKCKDGLGRTDGYDMIKKEVNDLWQQLTSFTWKMLINW